MKAGKAILACAAGVGMLMAVQNASAITYDITSDHATGGLGTPPFGTVELIQNLTTVDVTVSLASGYSFVSTGAADNMDFKFNANDVALGEITVDQNAIYPLFAATGSFNGDGTGNFGFGITGYTGLKNDGSQPNGAAGAFDTDIKFHVANATIADLTHPNNLGILFVADLLAPNGNTGPADVTVPGVPDGGLTLALLGLALAGLGSFSKLFKK